MNEAKRVRRRPWVAAILSVFCTGLGHVYCGRIATGLVLFAATMLYVPFATYALLFGSSTPLTIVAMVLGLVSLVAAVYAVIASFVIARRIGDGYDLKDYNRPVVYVTFLLIVGLSAPLGSASFLRENVAEAFYCPAQSMFPNIIRGDRFLAAKRVYRDRDPQYGDVVVFLNPKDRHVNFVKRVVGLPGDRVEIRGGVVHLNGKALPQEPAANSLIGQDALPDDSGLFHETNGGRRYLIVRSRVTPSCRDHAETTVPPGHVFVLGDNRDRSADSRNFGCVPIGDIKGRATFLYWSAGRWNRFGPVDQGGDPPTSRS